MKFFFIFCINLVIIFSACSNNENESQQDPANVFKTLDGTWLGDFIVYVDTSGQQKGIAQPTSIDFDNIKKPSLKILSVIEAKHVYKSVSDYKQEGEITDIIKKSDGTTDTIISKATNLVENGNLKCFVHKPNETVIHNGEYLGNNTIVWQRSLSNPLKIEYFKETVNNDHYKIIGWGYYGSDDPALTPRYWFYADYEKVE